MGKIKILRNIVTAIAILFCCSIASRAQIYDVACPPNTSVLQQALNQSNGHYKAYECIDSQGNVTWLSGGQFSSVFNVKSYGAKGDTRSTYCNVSNGSPTVNCNVHSLFSGFSILDLGKRFNCVVNLGGTLNFAQGSTISSITDFTHAVISSNANTTNQTQCTFGTVDDIAINSAIAAWDAAISTLNGQQFGNELTPSIPPVLYFPAGGYTFCNYTNGAIGLPPQGNLFGASVKGDGIAATYWYPCDNTPSNSNGLFMFNNIAFLFVHDLTIDGAHFPLAGNPALVYTGTVPSVWRDVTIQRGNGGSGWKCAGEVDVFNMAASAVSGNALEADNCWGEFRSTSASNSTVNVVINGCPNSTGTGGIRWFGGLVDETGGSIPFQISNCNDLDVFGLAAFGTSGKSAVSVDGHSSVRWIGGKIGMFGGDTNAGGLTIALGGVFDASGIRFQGSGTAPCVNNSGRFRDNGDNSCENIFLIASGTSTGTTAVLTITNAGQAANVSCAVGDDLIVENSNNSGYDGLFQGGITAVTATTITYTTLGSNLGSIGANGNVACRNLKNYTGNVPETLLTTAANTWIQATAFTTGVNFGNQKLDQNIALIYIKIVSQSATNTSCATAPVFTLTDGTNNVTLQLTSGKTSWDSGVDVSTGIGTFFKRGATITGSFTTGTCTTPPVNASVTYDWRAVFSN